MYKAREKEMAGNLVAETLRGGLFTRIVGKRLLFFQEVGSTMDEALRRAERGTEEGTVVVAETQTASRGRQGRAWVSRTGNLYLSVVLYPSLQTLPYLNSLCGVAVVRAIANISGLKPRIKWPNDILLEGKKVAGVLVESAIAGEQVHHSIIGIGINVALEADEIDEIAGGAISLNHASAGDIPRDELLREILQQLDALYIQLNHGDTPVEEWEELLDTLGQRVKVTWQGEEYVGFADGIDAQGSLLLREDSGTMRTLAAGDATSLRPAP
ncbi:Bifunctional ligase/repressor BirA [Geodia barretti]|uniref:Bifunctional ligase/repressor BirA n=1 Tax=Geodia barretti TaxID=519541 RepID=A0AA35W5I0_GEOBA|nr:Bifunctional ligase/repressor BirA [Geodia barretti]